MKCPLITAGFWADPKTSGHDAIDCLKEECAWWDNVRGVCSVRVIADCLTTTMCIFSTIRDKMPHWRDVKK